MPEILIRISRAGHQDPFFWSRLGRDRFDLPDGRYGLLYTAQDLETCVLEVFGDRWLKERILPVTALPSFEVLTITVRLQLQVADLIGAALNRLGTDSNLFASNDYAVTQEWSRQLMIHPQARDGIRYHSRKNPRKHNYAIYDTAQGAKDENRVAGSSPIERVSRTLHHSRQLRGRPHWMRNFVVRSPSFA